MSHEQYQSCIDACTACAVECRHCASADLAEQDIKMLARCIQLNYDCAAICLTSVELMAGGSEFAKEYCAMCAKICDACAEECEKHSHLEHCKTCAEACRRCAEECRKMS